jgi:NAD(P)-dependent dehydrogenase (short-subunit alcohol dehydrogenase family)
MTVSTPGIRQDLDPSDWSHHRFGLSEAGWRRLSGRRFVVTGAGTGFGRAFATAIGLADAKVVLAGRRLEPLRESREAGQALGAKPGRFECEPMDINDPADVVEVMGRIAAAGPLHGIVANAAVPQGNGGPTPLLSSDESEWQRIVGTNLTAQWRVARSAINLAAPDGHVRAIFVTSEAGWADTPGVGLYNVSKAALNGLTMSLAAEAGHAFPDADVQINGLIPGEARTEMNRGSTESPWSAVPMLLHLLSHPEGGPNGRFFHRDGRHFDFAYARAWPKSLAQAARTAV